jgi:hypothetical protein
MPILTFCNVVLGLGLPPLLDGVSFAIDAVNACVWRGAKSQVKKNFVEKLYTSHWMHLSTPTSHHPMHDSNHAVAVWPAAVACRLL